MELLKINKLLEKYWEGETTLEEEAELRRFFREEETPAELRSIATLFRHYDAPPALDGEFDKQLLHRLERKKTVVMWPTMLKIAAILTVFLLGALWMKQQYLAPTPSAQEMAFEEDTYEDPEQAYEETKQALLLVSSLMNEGTEHLTKLEAFDEAQETAKKPATTEL